MPRKQVEKKILIISGEASGEANAAQLIAALGKKRGNLKFYASGGDNCRKAGAEILYNIENLGIMGFKAAFQKIPQVLKLRKVIKDFIIKEKPDLVIPVDFPDFNISMLRRIYKSGIPIVYFISPQIWAWRKKRINKLKKYIRRMLVLLPFEADIYKSKGVDVVYVGNPAVDRVKITEKPDEFRRKYRIPAGRPIITFLPGSRFHEIEDILPVMLRSIKLIERLGDFVFIFAPAGSVKTDRCEAIIEEEGLKDKVLLIPGGAHNAAAASSLVITKSGTSTIEMALIGTPFIVVYKTTPFAYLVIRTFYKRKKVSLVNIIGDGDQIPELIQAEFTPENIYAETKKILSDHKKRSEILRYLKGIRERLGPPGAAERAADAVLEIME
jgi:lipid-A-disaccharide synthase